jgi:glutathione S-transferase
MLEIWGRKNSGNVIVVMWAVGELGLEYKRHNVGGSFGGTNSPVYLEMNPNARVPTITDNGMTLWESNAIVRYLSSTYGRGTLYPDDPHTRAVADQWMEWLKSTVMPALFPVFWGMIRTPETDRDQIAIDRGVLETGKVLKILDQRLEKNDYVAGDRFTMGDIPLGANMYRYFNLSIDRPSLPNVEAWYGRLCQRSAFQQHAMIPFGTSPDEWLRLEKEGAGD